MFTNFTEASYKYLVVYFRIKNNDYGIYFSGAKKYSIMDVYMSKIKTRSQCYILVMRRERIAQCSYIPTNKSNGCLEKAPTNHNNPLDETNSSA